MRWLCVILLTVYVCGAKAASCPAGYVMIDNPYVTISDTCPSGTISVGVAAACDGNSVCWVMEKLRSLCGAGISRLRVSSGVSVPLYSDKVTTPSLNIRYNGKMCYADLEQGRASNAVNVKHNGLIYHTVE